jgi:hypothetical protein
MLRLRNQKKTGMDPVSAGGATYYIVYIDDYTRHTEVYFLTTKSAPEVASAENPSDILTKALSLMKHIDVGYSGKGGVLEIGPCSRRGGVLEIGFARWEADKVWDKSSDD